MSKVTIIRHLFKGDIFWRFCWYHISGYLNDRIHACYCKSLTNKGKIRKQKFKNLSKLYGLQGVSSDSTVSLYQDKPVNLYETPCITLITDELIYRTKGQFSFLYLCNTTTNISSGSAIFNENSWVAKIPGPYKRWIYRGSNIL